MPLLCTFKYYLDYTWPVHTYCLFTTLRSTQSPGWAPPPGGGSLPETRALLRGVSGRHTTSRTEESQPSFPVKARPREARPWDALGRGTQGRGRLSSGRPAGLCAGGHPEPPTPLWSLGNYPAPRVVMKGRNSLL